MSLLRTTRSTLVCVLLTAAAVPEEAFAQQALYAVACEGQLVEIVDYATTPSVRPILPAGSFFAQDIAVRPTTGTLLVTDWTLGIVGITEIDPATGSVLHGPSCFTWVGSPGGFDAWPDGSQIGVDWFAPGHLLPVGAQAICFHELGPATGHANRGDIATTRDGQLLTTRAGSTELASVDPLTGASTVAMDPGVSFAGLEVDSDGAVYGLAADGGFYRVDSGGSSATLLGVLPPVASGSCVANGWQGLGFRAPAVPVAEAEACPGAVNSTGLTATLRVRAVRGSGNDELEFALGDAPPNSIALLLHSPTTATLPLGNGTLCLGSGGSRVYPPQPTDTLGRATLTMDFGGQGGLPAPGTTVYVQVVYRDADPTSTINFSDARSLSFL